MLFWATYDPANEEAVVTFHKEFLSIPIVGQLDCLQDAITELQNIYEELLEKESEK